MKRIQFESKMNEAAAKLLAEGYGLSLNETTACYGAVDGTQVCFAKGNAREIIWVRRVDNINDDWCDPIDALEICRAHIDLEPGESFRYMGGRRNCVEEWEKHIVETFVVYAVTSRYGGGDWYVEDYDEVLAMRAKKAARREARRGTDKLRNRDFEMTDELLRIVRKVHGFKTVKRENILVSKTRGYNDGSTYRIQNAVTGNCVELH